MDELRTTGTKKLINKELKDATNKIKACGDNIRKNYIKISFLLNEVDEKECYFDDGFSDIQEYASKVLNIQKTTCYNLLKIGKEFINEKGTRTVLTDMGNDYGVSQLQVLLPIGVDKAKELHDAGEISPDMSVRQLKNIVSPKPEKDTEQDNEPIDAEIKEEIEIPRVMSATFYDDGTIMFDNVPEEFENYVETIREMYKALIEN